jgi:hypothetical protein
VASVKLREVIHEKRLESFGVFSMHECQRSICAGVIAPA